MFSLKIIDTDLFLDLPSTSQLLYFHLAMRADDDGFIGNPKKIMRFIGCREDDMKLLIAKKFIIPFESGICVIKHWEVHNWIRKDRYTPTLYKLEKSTLTSIDNVYELSNVIPDVIPSVIPDVIPSVIPDVIPLVATGKDRLGKGSIDKNICVDEENKPKPKPKKKTENKEAKELFDYWNDLILKAGLMKKGKKFTKEVEKIIDARLKYHSIDDLKKMLDKLSNNEYYLGNNDNRMVYFTKHKTVFNKSKCDDRIENLEVKPIEVKNNTNQKKNSFNAGCNHFAGKYTNDELEKILGVKK